MTTPEDEDFYFKTPTYREYEIHALKLPDHEAEIRIVKNGTVTRKFGWPGYKVWNIASHASEIIDDEIRDEHTLTRAGSDLLGGGVVPREIP